MLSTSKAAFFQNLYEFSDPMAIEPLRLRSRLPGKSGTGGIDFDLQSLGKPQVREPIQFDATRGWEASDFLWTQRVMPVCISERAIELLKEYDLSGWSTYPVDVFDQGGNLVTDYQGFAVTGPVCIADYSKSTRVRKPPPTPLGKSYDVFRGLYFDIDEWDGSDMFWVGRVRVVLDKVKRAFEQNKVSNVVFTPLTEREIRVRDIRRP